MLLKFYAVGLSRAVMRSQDPDCTVLRETFSFLCFEHFLPFIVKCIVSALVLCQSLSHVALMLKITISNFNQFDSCLASIASVSPLGIHTSQSPDGPSLGLTAS